MELCISQEGILNIKESSMPDKVKACLTNNKGE
jgi:hypothetical protein